MTKTQANEPGFVLVPHEPTEVMTVAGIVAGIGAGTIGERWAPAAYRAMIDAAPLVPSPAYGGVRALEWGDSKSHGGRCLVGRDANGAEIARVYYDANREAVTSSRIVAKQAAAQADFERRVLSCPSPVAVEEADADAAAWRDMATAPKDGTLLALLVRPYTKDEEGAWTPFEDSRAPQPTIGFNNFDDTEEDRWQFAGWSWCHDTIVEGHGEVIGWRPFGEKLPSVTPEETVLAAIAEWGEGPCDDLEQLQRQVALALRSHAAPSTPSPQIGKAGAGPVGEAVAFEFDRYIDGTLMAEGVKIERQPTLEKASRRAAQIASRGPNGEVPVLVLRTLLYPRPVEEPGEVERFDFDAHSLKVGLARQTKRAETAEAEVERLNDLVLKLSTDIDGFWKPQFDEQVTRAETAEASLAETREHLEKLVAASSKARTALAGFTSVDDAAFALDVAIGEVADWKRSAALTGDAQEGGK